MKNQVLFSIGFFVIGIGMIALSAGEKVLPENDCQPLQLECEEKYIYEKIEEFTFNKKGYSCFYLNLTTIDSNQAEFDLNVAFLDNENNIIEGPFIYSNVLLLAANSPIEVTEQFMRDVILQNQPNVISADYNSFYSKIHTPSLRYKEKGDFLNKGQKVVYIYYIYKYRLQKDLEAKKVIFDKWPYGKQRQDKTYFILNLDIKPIKEIDLFERYFLNRPQGLFNSLLVQKNFRYSLQNEKIDTFIDHTKRLQMHNYYLVSAKYAQEKLTEENQLVLELSSQFPYVFYKFIDDSSMNNIIPAHYFYERKMKHLNIKKYKRITFDLNQFIDPYTKKPKDLIILIGATTHLGFKISILPKKNCKK